MQSLINGQTCNNDQVSGGEKARNKTNCVQTT